MAIQGKTYTNKQYYFAGECSDALTHQNVHIKLTIQQGIISFVLKTTSAGRRTTQQTLSQNDEHNAPHSVCKCCDIVRIIDNSIGTSTQALDNHHHQQMTLRRFFASLFAEEEEQKTGL